MSDLVKLEEAQVIDLYTKGEALDPLVEAVRETVEGFEHDLSTATGRKRTASLAAKVSKAKTFLDGLGKDLVSDWKQKAKVVDEARKKMRDELDALRDQARAPLTEWEKAEEEKEAKIQSFLSMIQEFRIIEIESSSFVDDKISCLQRIHINSELGDREAEAFKLKDEVLAFLQGRYKALKAKEEEEAEKEKIRLAAEEEMRLAREEQLRKEGEERAKREAEEARIRREEEVRREAEAMKREAEEAELMALRAKEEAERRAERAEAEARAKVEAERLATEKAEAQRRANEAHSKSIKTSVKKSLMAIGVDEKMAVKIVLAICNGDVKHTSIRF